MSQEPETAALVGGEPWKQTWGVQGDEGEEVTVAQIHEAATM